MLRSPHNDRIKRARSLQTRKGRERAGAFLVESPRALRTVLDAGAEVEQVFAAGELEQELAEALARAGVEVVPVSAEVLESVTETVTPSGCVAVVRSPARADEPPGPLLLVLDEVRDPGNVGTLLRTADAVGADVVLAGGCADPLAPKVVRASAGAVVRVRWWRRSVDETMAALAELPHAPVVLEASAAETLYQRPLPWPLALIAGNEAHGPAVAWRGEARRLPMVAGAESLNVGVAAAVAVYEAVRQHGWRVGDEGAE